MLTRTFLQHISPDVLVRIIDLDAIPGNNLKEAPASVMMAAHRFNYNSEVIDFQIYHDNIKILIKRHKEDKT